MGMSATPAARILLVSKLRDAEEIASALVGAGLSAPVIASGGDDTLTLCEEVAPDVVVLSASLDEGDARSLATAMRGSRHGSRLRIVLIGDATGPIRNALDASDFEVDRFVGRPLSAKALAFAVRSCASEIAEASAGSEMEAEGQGTATARPPIGQAGSLVAAAEAGGRAATAPMISGERTGRVSQGGRQRAQEDAISARAASGRVAPEAGGADAADSMSGRAASGRAASGRVAPEAGGVGVADSRSGRAASARALSEAGGVGASDARSGRAASEVGGVGAADSMSGRAASEAVDVGDSETSGVAASGEAAMLALSGLPAEGAPVLADGSAVGGRAGLPGEPGPAVASTAGLSGAGPTGASGPMAPVAAARSRSPSRSGGGTSLWSRSESESTPPPSRARDAGSAAAAVPGAARDEVLAGARPGTPARGSTAGFPPGRVVAAAQGPATRPIHGAGPSWPTPRPLPPPPQPPERFPMRMATTPGTGPGMPPGPVVAGSRRPGDGPTPGLERAMDEAITRFVSDAMSALETGWTIDPDRDGRVQDSVEDLTARTVNAGRGAGRRARAPSSDSDAASADGYEDDGADSAAGEAGGRLASPVYSRSGDFEAAAPLGSRLGEPAMGGNGSSAPMAGEPDGVWREPPPAPAWREPTLILPGGGQGAAPVPSRVDPADVDATAPQSSSPWDEDVAADSSVDASAPDPRPRRVRARSEGGVELADDADDLPDYELDRDLEGGPAGLLGALEAGGDPAAPPPEGERPRSVLARELRRKMSMMAERLFPGRGGDRPRLDMGLAHDAHTEIDLASIGVETPDDAERSTPYEAIHNVDTFADTNPRSRLEPTPTGDMQTDEREETTGRRRSITREPPARGDLADIDVASLMGRLLQNRFTGRVQLRRGPAEKAIQFEDGRPVFAISNLPHDRMGDLLYREGKITREQQQRARDLVVESGRRMGEILVEFGFLKPRELLPAVRHHIEDIVYSVFAWDSGEFAVSSGDSTTERIRLTRHPAAIVLEGVRRKYGPDLLEARLGSAGAVVAVRSQRQLGAIAAVADLSPAERAVIQKLDGERTIQQVAEAAQVDHLAALQLAFGLVALGVAEVVDHGPSALERAPVRARSLVGETDIAIDRQRVLAKHALVHEADYFTLLGVRRDATSFEIRRAYEAARRDYASTVFPSELQRELAGELGEINQVIDEAYQVLRDEQVRRSYQANLLD